MKVKRKATNVVIYVFVTLVSLSAIVPLFVCAADFAEDLRPDL